jgi:hypothetical protein
MKAERSRLPKKIAYFAKTLLLWMMLISGIALAARHSQAEDAPLFVKLIELK